MKNNLLLLLLLGFATGVLSCQSQSAGNDIKSATAIIEIFGDGQKVTAAALEWDKDIDNASLSAKSFSVAGRTITKVYAAPAAQKSTSGSNGRFVIIELSDDNKTAATIEPQGPKSNTINPTLSVQQLEDIRAADGSVIHPSGNAVKTDKQIRPVVDDFKQLEYKDPKTGITVIYNLFVPRNYDKSKSYPMVMFIHDAGVVSTDPKATLVQGLGAVIWATPSEQAKHECFVLAPQYSVVTVNDNSEATADLDATVSLINDLTARYNIDKNRLYTTGQSMGCMSSIALNIKYPDLFAASFLVAGQWDAAKVAPMAADKLWIIVSEGDEKAFPGMNAITAALAKRGAKISRATWSGQWSATEFSDAASMILQENSSINYTPLKKGTVVPANAQNERGGDHRYTWRIAYTIEDVRDWLFAQRKN